MGWYRCLRVAIASILGNGKHIQHFLDFPVLYHAAHAHAAGVLAGHHHLQAAGFDVQQVEPLHVGTHSPAAYLFDNSNAMIGIDDLIADVEIQVGTSHKRHPGKAGLRGEAVVDPMKYGTPG